MMVDTPISLLCRRFSRWRELRFRLWLLRAVASAWITVAALATVSGCSPGPSAEISRSIPWSFGGTWLVADLHTHSTFSDGSLHADAVVATAVDAGCDVFALTDHSDLSPRVTTTSAEYFSVLQALRSRHPGLVLIGGIEWNVPPYNGREHVNLLVEPALEATLLPVFRERFDSVGRAEGSGYPSSVSALRWLFDQLPAMDDAVLFYNHPSRKVERIEESGEDLLHWRRVSPLMIGFEGAPGHQRMSNTGSYGKLFKTQDRWDPVAARVGGVWDSLLDRGVDVWGALANSDFHNNNMDYPPCAFSRTHIQVPEPNASGVLRALKAGSFWADHGRILKKLALVVDAPGLELPAVPGEMLSVDSEAVLSVRLVVERDEGGESEPLLAELIGNCKDGRPASISAKNIEVGETAVVWELGELRSGADGDSCFIRVRVRKTVEKKPDLLAYSNPIRIVFH